MNIYVGNLSRTVTEETLRKLFEGYGAVSSVKIMTDKFTGEARGFGFLTMEDDVQAEEAIAALNNSELEGQRLRVNTARPPEARPARTGGPRTGGGFGGGSRDRFGGPRSSGGSSNGGGYRGGSSRY